MKGKERKILYRAEELQQLAARVCECVGVPLEDAKILADSLIDANLCGTDTHGVTRLAIYVRRIQRGLINPKTDFRIERASNSTVVIDGNNGIGQVLGVKAVEIIVEKARRTGVGIATIKHSQHFGQCSYYGKLIAQRDMLGICFTNAEPAMPPWGGSEAYFGTNPICFVCPTGLGFPIKIDMATSITARGKIIAAAKRGEKIPLGWAIDAEGNPTNDPEKALIGAVLTMAEHKGYALALMVEVLAGILSGSGFGVGVGSMYKQFDREADVGHFLAAIDIASFMPLEEFKRRIDRMVREIKACKRREGVAEILVPGERSYRTRLERERNGIPLPEEVVQELRLLCEDLGIKFEYIG